MKTENDMNGLDVKNVDGEMEIVEKKIEGGAREFTDEQIAQFQEECGKRPTYSIADFNQAIEKSCEELTYKDVRIIIGKVGWLSSIEREKFRPILFEENLTKEELEKYTNLYGNGHLFSRYFYKKETVEK
jgi:hypothetical protein